MIKISHHAMESSRQRLRLSYQDFQELANKAYIYGIGIQYMSGKLRDYLARRRKGYANERSNAVFYGTGVFIFIGRFLVTVYQIPEKYLQIANSQSTKVEQTQEK